MKNFLVLGLLTIVTLSYAKEPIEKESMEEAEGFKSRSEAKKQVVKLKNIIKHILIAQKAIE